MVKELKERFGIGDKLSFELDEHGMDRAVIETADVQAKIYLNGAHITEFTPAGHRPLLFLSSKSNFTRGKAIRGGIPIIFPWFGAKAGDPSAPMHGFARTAQWKIDNTSLFEDTVVSIDFSLDAANQIHLRYSVMIASGLRVELAVHNRSEHPFTFEEALHNYLAVSDVRNVSITGLESSEFIDKTDSMNRKTSPPHPLRLESETDRVYVNTTAWCRIYDSDWERRITLRKSNSSTTVVWNPWIETARKMTDLAAEEWKSMLCIETANAADNAITLNPGDEHRMALSITASPQSPSSPPP